MFISCLKSYLKDKLALASLGYIIEDITGTRIGSFYPVIDGVTISNFEDLNKENLRGFIDLAEKIIDEAQKISGGDDKKKAIMISLSALILLASKYTENPIDYLKANRLISKNSLELLDDAKNLLDFIKKLKKELNKPR